MNVQLSKTKQLTIETFTGNANGKKFTGIRIREGKKKPKTLAHWHYSKTQLLIDALQAALDSVDEQTGGFYQSRQWQSLRYQVLKRDGGKCSLCGSSDRLHVDHIKPRSKHPELELEPSNLQVLCSVCNVGKSNKDDTDWPKAINQD